MILADTHSAIWLTEDRRLLSKAADRALTEARSRGSVAISCFTLREIAMLVSMKRVTIGTPLGPYLRFIESIFQVLPINGAVAERSTLFLPDYPKDPADRLIGATAIVFGLKLVTKDKGIRASKEVDCIW